MKATFYDVKQKCKVDAEVTAKVKLPNGRHALKAKTPDGRNLTRFVTKSDFDKADV